MSAPLDLDAIRRSFHPGRGERAEGNIVLRLCEEIERLREDALPIFIAQQIVFSRATFGPGARTAGLLAHIREELAEIEAAPRDLEEWCDVILLAIDGAWRAGHGPAEITAGLLAKAAKNRARRWPAATPEDRPSNHLAE